MDGKIWLYCLLCISSTTVYAELGTPMPQQMLNNLSSVDAALLIQPAHLHDTHFRRKGFDRDCCLESQQDLSQAQNRFHFETQSASKFPRLLKYGATFIARSIALSSGVTAPQESFGIVPKNLDRAPIIAQEGIFNIRN